MSSNNTPTVSTSDLVPFVAAVLQDQAVTDKIEELQQQLNNANDERLLVQVTGRNGTPVHYQASLKDGGTFYGGDRSMWMVPFGKKKEENLVLDLNLIDGLEVRLSGNRLFYLKDTRYDTEYYDDDFNRDSDKSQMGGIRFQNIHSQTFVHSKIGPIRLRDYRDLHLMNVPELAILANNNTNQTEHLIITAVVFPMDMLNDSKISLLNKMGISTTYEHDQSWVSSVRSTGRPPVEYNWFQKRELLVQLEFVFWKNACLLNPPKDIDLVHYCVCGGWKKNKAASRRDSMISIAITNILPFLDM